MTLGSSPQSYPNCAMAVSPGCHLVHGTKQENTTQTKTQNPSQCFQPGHSPILWTLVFASSEREVFMCIFIEEGLHRVLAS